METVIGKFVALAVVALMLYGISRWIRRFP